MPGYAYVVQFYDSEILPRFAGLHLFRNLAKEFLTDQVTMSDVMNSFIFHPCPGSFVLVFSQPFVFVHVQHGY
jgi:hypothetical protein